MTNKCKELVQQIFNYEEKMGWLLILPLKSEISIENTEIPDWMELAEEFHNFLREEGVSYSHITPNRNGRFVVSGLKW